MVRAFCPVVGALLALGQVNAFFGSPSAFMTGTMSAGLRTPGATSALGREARTYRRSSTAKSGAASTVMMPIGVPKVCLFSACFRNLLATTENVSCGGC